METTIVACDIRIGDTFHIKSKKSLKILNCLYAIQDMNIKGDETALKSFLFQKARVLLIEKSHIKLGSLAAVDAVTASEKPNLNYDS